MKAILLLYNGVIVFAAVSCWTLSLSCSVSAFATGGPRPRVGNTLRLKVLSLDDSWDDVAQVFESTNQQALLLIRQLEQSQQSLQWQNPLSNAWFATLGNELQNVLDLVLLSSHGVVASAPVLLPLVAIFSSLLALAYSISFPPHDYRSGREPYPRGNYDPIAARAYYARQPWLVLQRSLELLRLTYSFGLALLLDKYVWKNLERQQQNEEQRAKELLTLITKLGPTAIKVGQALSVRPDLIPTAYAQALATLQDQVPPFEGAREILQRELGSRLAQLQDMSLDRPPIASASIGQVYKATLRMGTSDTTKPVAVKVQRPNVLADIALDLYIVRELVAPLYQKVTKTSTDLQALTNEWGRGFIAELDYRQEAARTSQFNREMRKRQLTAVMAPAVVPAFSEEQVLVTEWVDGKRLDDAVDVSDVPRLCSVALNAYLVMLLETQVLHCDPHPGNLLRTADGKLCILDWGMTLDIDPDLQYSLLEFVAHLTSENYDDLPQDMVALGFLAPDKLEFCQRSGVLEPLKYFLKQAGQGGGAEGVRNRIFAEYRLKYPDAQDDDELRVAMRAEMKEQMKSVVERESVATGITYQVEELQRKNRDAFRIPEWFVYTSRAFLTLEGVSLQADPSYSLIKSCFPYVAKRLVADDDPRARKALKELLYGASDVLDVDRLGDLADGFSSYTTSTKTTHQQQGSKVAWASNEVVKNRPPFQTQSSLALSEGKTPQADRKKRLVEAEAAITLAKDSADILLSPTGNLVQNLLVEESAKATSARFKDVVRQTLVDGPKRFRDGLPLRMGVFLPELPFEQQLRPFVQKTDEEVKAQDLAEKLTALAARSTGTASGAIPGSKGITSFVPSSGSNSTAMAFVDMLREMDPEQAALVLRAIRTNVPKYAPLLGQLGGKFVSTLLRTASLNIESTLTELENAGKRPDNLVKVTAKGLSTVAQRGAKRISNK